MYRIIAVSKYNSLGSEAAPILRAFFMPIRYRQPNPVSLSDKDGQAQRCALTTGSGLPFFHACKS